MPTYKLTYHRRFFRGRAEVARLLFQLSGTPYVDERLEIEDWQNRKSGTPFGQLPVLEVDSKVIPQSFAIIRYLAKQFGYAGSNDFEAAWVDAIGDQFKDYADEIRPFFSVALGFAAGDKEKLQKEVGEPTRDKFIGILEKRLQESKSGFLVGEGLTWVDLTLAENVTTFEANVPGFFDHFPAVLTHQKKIHEIPKIKEWIELRPKTPY